jgi:hypothetical protein
MSDLNKDGNLFGRLTAAAVLVVAAVGIARIAGIGCPICESCSVSAPK